MEVGGPALSVEEIIAQDPRERALSLPSPSCHLLSLVHRESSRAHVDEEQEATNDGERLEEVVSEEVASRVRSVHGPEVVDKNLQKRTLSAVERGRGKRRVGVAHVEDAQQQHQEARAPAGLEANGDHDTCAEAKDRDDDSGNRPGALDDEADEEEDEQHSPGKL